MCHKSLMGLPATNSSTGHITSCRRAKHALMEAA